MRTQANVNQQQIRGFQRARTFVYALCLTWHLASLAAGSATAEPVATAHERPALVTPEEYSINYCDGLRQTYEPLIAANLSPWAGGAASVSEILKLQGWRTRLGSWRPASPQVIILNNTIMTLQKPELNVAAYLIPLLTKLTSVVTLPDMAIAASGMDEPQEHAPWYGYCNVIPKTNNILYPANPPMETKLSCGELCQPFTDQDTRLAKAVFLGSTTGWDTGSRRAVVLAGLKSDYVDSGFTKLVDISDQTVKAQDPTIRRLKPTMSLQKQISRYKYIINADGHCAALRFRHLLASDSAVFWLTSNQTEYFYSLLQPYVHYVPVEYDASDLDWTWQDLERKIEWANANPAKVLAVVRNANKFAETHLSDHGMTCYAVQLLYEYSLLFTDLGILHNLAAEGAFATAHVQVRRGRTFLSKLAYVFG